MITEMALKIGNRERAFHSYEHKFGSNPNLVSGTQTIWTQGGSYPWNAFNTAGPLTLQSTNALDIFDVRIYGLDSNWELQEEVITLTGTTPVVTTKSWKRVYRGVAYQTNAGTITASIAGSVVLHIEEGKGQTLMCVYTVPSGYRAFGVQFTVGVGKGGDAEFQMFTRNNDAQTEAFRVRAQLELYESTFTQTYAVPVLLKERTDIDLKAVTSGNNFPATGSFDLILHKV